LLLVVLVVDILASPERCVIHFNARMTIFGNETTLCRVYFAVIGSLGLDLLLD